MLDAKLMRSILQVKHAPCGTTGLVMLEHVRLELVTVGDGDWVVFAHGVEVHVGVDVVILTLPAVFASKAHTNH